MSSERRIHTRAAQRETILHFFAIGVDFRPKKVITERVGPPLAVAGTLFSSPRCQVASATHLNLP
jgi:hypothetical protein